MKADATSERILDRLEDGYQTPEQVLNCGECSRPIFDLTLEQVQSIMDEMVAEGTVTRVRQGQSHLAQGSHPVWLYIPREQT